MKRKVLVEYTPENDQEEAILRRHVTRLPHKYRMIGRPTYTALEAEDERIQAELHKITSDKLKELIDETGSL